MKNKEEWEFNKINKERWYYKTEKTKEILRILALMYNQINNHK